MTAVPTAFVAKWMAYANNVTSVNPWAIGVSAGALAILLLWPRVSLRVPSPFVALIVTTVVVHVGHLPVETIGDRFGTIRASLPSPHLPSVSWDMLRGLVAPTFTIALLAAIESLLSAVVADGMIGTRHRSNMELVAQGVANIASPLFGGIPVTGENEAVCEGFAAAHPGFECLGVDTVLGDLKVPSAADLTKSGNLRLWPHLHATDGFFASIWVKI